MSPNINVLKLYTVFLVMLHVNQSNYGVLYHSLRSCQSCIFQYGVQYGVPLTKSHQYSLVSTVTA